VWGRIATVLAIAATGFGRVLWRVTRELFHEVTGALFVLLSVMGASAAWRYWQQDAGKWHIALALIFAGGMAAFAVVSFCRARRVK
jgi:uncharacterized membrane protein